MTEDRNSLTLLQQWDLAQKKLKEVKDEEIALRKKVVAEFFENPEEGTNKEDLPQGYTLKLTHKYNRTIDQAALPAVLEQLDDGAEDRLVNYKPSVDLREYRKLTDANRHIFDEALVIKPATPSLEIVPPKGDK